MNSERPVVATSYEDPSQPDIILHKISPASSYLQDNLPGGYNERQIIWALIVFVFAYWDEDVRKQLAKARQVESSSIVIDAFGDLRLLRNSIAHNGGVVSATIHKRLRVLGDLCEPDKPLSLEHDQVHVLFVRLKQAVAALAFTFVKDVPGLADPTELTGIAIGGPLSWSNDDSRPDVRREMRNTGTRSRKPANSKNFDGNILFSLVCGIFNVELLEPDVVVPRAKTTPIIRSMLPLVFFPNNSAFLTFRATESGKLICECRVVASWAGRPALHKEPWLRLQTPNATEIVNVLQKHVGKQVELAFISITTGL